MNSPIRDHTPNARFDASVIPVVLAARPYRGPAPAYPTTYVPETGLLLNDAGTRALVMFNFITWERDGTSCNTWLPRSQASVHNDVTLKHLAHPDHDLFLEYVDSYVWAVAADRAWRLQKHLAYIPQKDLVAAGYPRTTARRARGDYPSVEVHFVPPAEREDGPLDEDDLCMAEQLLAERWGLTPATKP